MTRVTTVALTVLLASCAGSTDMVGQGQVEAGGIIDTGQDTCYDNAGPITCPAPGEAFYGQDAQYQGLQPRYVDNGDGTIDDIHTGLMWVQAQSERMSWDDAVAGAATFSLAGYDDWRMPTIKELYSLIDFRGGYDPTSDENSRAYIDTDYFEFMWGDQSGGNRPIDVQYWSATEYVGTTMGGNPTVFGVNFADGRIKGYPKSMPGRGAHLTFVKYVRGNPDYAVNDFQDNGDGTVLDRSTKLTWQQADSRPTYDWTGALWYCEGLELAGHADWRLPNAKELQSIVDYTRAPAVTKTAAIDPIFQITDDESYFWTGTTHFDGPPDMRGTFAVYVTFGRAMGHMEVPPRSGDYQFIDVHGGGAQRSDPKTGDPADWPRGNGPQGDDVRIFNYGRCVR
ncbi:MAG: DUF1566 domain-containing protein [Gemmatimonadales bacterium]|nr:MAG: DUF1566 domain-containing protein [Gemmatimonadales bacterium]